MVDTVLQAQEQNKQMTGGRSSLLAMVDTVLQAQEQNKQVTGGRSSLLAPYGRHSSTGTRTKQTDDRWQIFSPSSIW